MRKKNRYRVRVDVSHTVVVEAPSAQAAELEGLVAVSKLHGDDLDLMHVTNVTMLPSREKEAV